MAQTKRSESKGQPQAESFFMFDLRHIKANAIQSRKPGVLRNLNDEAYGLTVVYEILAQAECSCAEPSEQPGGKNRRSARGITFLCLFCNRTSLQFADA